MLMQSNEPFSRVDQGMSPMTAGLLTGLATGGAAAGFQGLSHLSYSGLQAKHDSLKEGVASLTKDLSETDKTKMRKGMSLGERVTDIKLYGQSHLENYRRNVASGEAAATLRDIKNNKEETRRIAQKRKGGHTGPVIIDMQGEANNRSLPGGNVEYAPSTFTRQPEPLTRGEQATWDKYGVAGSSWSEFRQQRARRDKHLENVNQINQRRQVMRGEHEVENSEYKKINKKLQKKQKALDNFDLQKQQEAHRWHGQTVGKAAMKSGAFALGGFVVGGGIQMAANSFNNA